VTAYVGVVCLDRGRPSVWRPDGSIGALEGVGVGEPRKLQLDGALFLLRQRVVSPEDRYERQPWLVFGGQGAVLFDGRLDNRDDLIAALGLRDDGALPDGLIAAGACERWGAMAAAHMRGDFAVACWDGRSRELHLMRERLGRLPLYWHRQGDVVAFATTLRALLSVPLVPRELDEFGLADFLALNHAVQEQTVYRDIFRVPLAHTVTHDAKGTHRHRYASFDPDRRVRLKDAREYEEAAMDLLAKAVRAMGRTMGPAPLLASNGLDSTLLAATLSRGASGTVPVLTILPEGGFRDHAPPGAFADDMALSAQMASAFPNLRIEHVRPVAEHEVEADPAALFARAAVPVRGVMNVAWFDAAHRRLRDMGARAAFTGIWGSMTMTWDGHRGLGDYLTLGASPRLAWELGWLGRRAPGALRMNILVPRFGRLPYETLWHAGTALRPEVGEALDVDGRMIAAGRDPTYVGPADSRQFRIAGVQNGAAHESDTNVYFRNAYGFLTCNPLLDARLAEWCLAIPVGQYLSRGRGRWLARRMLRRLGVPDAIAFNTKKGRQCPEWFARAERQRATVAARVSSLRKSPLANRLIDIERLERLLVEWPHDAAQADKRTYEYRYMLTRAAHVGSFIRWVERGNE
jgi:asparagine synthase (glutamine-hydrolysing)